MNRTNEGLRANDQESECADRSKRKNLGRLPFKVGEPFKPAQLRELTGGRIYPPAVFGRLYDISDGVKRLYDVLYRRVGQNDACWPSFASLANDLGKSERQVRYDLKKLASLSLIKTEWRTGRRSNTYRFLWHEMFERQSIAGQDNGSLTASRQSEPQSTTDDVNNEGPSIAARERQDTANLNGNGLPGNSFKECYQGNSSSGLTVEPVAKPSDDESSSSNQNNQKLTVEQAIDWGFSEGEEDPLLSPGPLPVTFLKAVSLKLQRAKCSTRWGFSGLSRCPRPDLAFAAEIAEPWRGKGALALADWMLGTVERELGTKSRATGPFPYGLYLSDSQAAARIWERENHRVQPYTRRGWSRGSARR